MKRLYILAGLLLITMLMIAPAAYAGTDTYQTYNLAWSGTPYGNIASATGQITLDLTRMPISDAGGVPLLSDNDIRDLTVTVVNASSGNGTWTENDLLNAVFFDGRGAPLNMTANLFAQQTLGGLWGSTHDGSTGEFNLQFGNGGPWGSGFFTMKTNSLAGDQLLLTEFSPTSVTPEPGTMLLLGTGLAGLAKMARRKLAQRA